MEKSRQTENIAQVDIDPNSLLSAFAIALRNIRANLLAEPEIDLALIQQSFLKTILTLTIPLTDDLKNFLEFPIAASWQEGQENLMKVFYSGLGPDSDDGSTRIQEIQKVLNGKIEETRRESRIEVLQAFLSDKKTDYPESLREIDGCWPFTLRGYEKEKEKELKFLIFYSVHRFNEKEPLPEEGEAQKEVVREAFQKMFFESGYKSIEFLVGTTSKYKKLDKDTLEQPSFLKDIISAIQDQITRLRRAPNHTQNPSITNAYVDLQEVFRVVFVTPTLVHENEETKLFFKYELSYQQIDYLNTYFAEEKKIIEDKEKEILAELRDEYDELPIKKPQEIRLSDVENDLRIIINDLIDQGLYKTNGKVEEYLRKAIYIYYAFEEKSKQDFDKKVPPPGLAKAIEDKEGYVTEKDAFLINQVFESRRPDVVSNLVNHPLSKLGQHSTDKLIKSFEKEFDKVTLYPRFLLLFETLFFPKRMFMYPMYQYDAPVILCACDADYYAFVRQSLKSILDRYTEGIFTTIIEVKRTEAIKRLAIVLKDTEDEKIIRDAFQKELHQLVLLFSNGLKNAKSLRTSSKDINTPLADEMNKEGQQVQVYVPDLSRSFLTKGSDGKEVFITSSRGQHILQLYLQEFEEIFCRIWENNKLIRANEWGNLSSAVAHGVKTSLSPIASLSSDFKKDIEVFSEFVENVVNYRDKESETKFADADLDTDQLNFYKLNSLSKVLSFYAEDTHMKVSLLYGGLKKEWDGQKEETPISSYIMAGLLRGYCIALILMDSNIVSEGKIRPTVFTINGKNISFRVRDIQAALGDYELLDDNGIEIKLDDLKFDKLKELDIGYSIETDKRLPMAKNKLLVIAVEELTLNALKSLGLNGPIVISSDDEYLFSIENLASTRITDVSKLKERIGKQEMGGLHTAFYIVEDKEHLNFVFETKSVELEGKAHSYRNTATIKERHHG